jgi:hypothetical protein
MPNIMWESSVSYDPRSKQVVRHGGHVLGGYAQSRFTFLYGTESRSFNYSKAPRPAPRQCLVDSTFLGSIGRTAYVNGGAAHGSIPYGSFQAGFTKIDIGDSLGPWLYDGATDTWEEARTFPSEWTRKNHMQVAWDGSTDAMLGLYGDKLTVYSAHANKTTYRALPMPLLLRSAYGIAADPIHGKVVLFGGASNGSWEGFPGDPVVNYADHIKADTWIYDASADTWKDVTSTVAPPPGMPRSDMVKLPMIWHASSGRIILHQVPVSTPNLDYTSWPDAEFWAFDVERETWSKLPVSGDIPAFFGSMAYDSDRDEIVMFGGGRDGDSQRPNLSRELYVCKVALDGAPRPTLPVNLNIDVSKTEVSLSWDAGLGPMDIYRAKADGVASTYSLVKSGVTTGTYSEPVAADPSAYRVMAKEKSLASSVVFDSPNRPTGMVASVESATSVRLSWAANAGLSYRVYRARGGEIGNGQGKLLGETATGTLTDMSDDLSDGVARFYWVTAVSPAGRESGPSPYATSMPDRAESVHIESAGVGKTLLQWQWNNGTKVAGFRVYHVNRHMNTNDCPADVIGHGEA